LPTDEVAIAETGAQELDAIALGYPAAAIITGSAEHLFVDHVAGIVIALARSNTAGRVSPPDHRP